MSTGSKGDKPGGPAIRPPFYIFDLPIQEIRQGYRSDVYFWREKLILERDHRNPVVTMQVFQKNRRSCAASMKPSPSSRWGQGTIPI